ncbi:MAG: ABC transporter ATP-binding protein [Acidimicrobiales bacterium]|nr:ABC transporter ATP-binding protein [Acidimicrobiales bacterium]
MTDTAPTEAARAAEDAVLVVDDLRTYFHTRDGVAHAVDGVSFSIRRGEVLGIVGESGCGKSVTSLSVMGLVPKPGVIESGQVFFEGRNLREMSRRELERIRGAEVSMIFQQPQSSLNPVQRAGDQIAEVYRIHRGTSKKDAAKLAIEALTTVGIPDPEKRADAYPHELSGGMAQRVMIAMALALEPALLIADEPTTALDVTIQAQILDLMRGLQRDFGTAVMLITHDLGVIAEMADRVAVMYAGQIVEETDVAQLFADPQHPYTQGLIGSIPVLGRNQAELTTIRGTVPPLIDLQPGCRFAGRCDARIEAGLDICTQVDPELALPTPDHAVRCWLHQPVPAASEVSS